MTQLGGELARKSVHIAMGGFALALRWLTPGQAAAFAGVALAFNLLLLHRLTGRRLLREGERERGFSAGIALYPGVVLALVLVFFRRMELAAAVWGLLAFGDGFATLAGKLLGGPRLPWNPGKSWAGFVAFVLWGTASAAFLIRWTQGLVGGGGPAEAGAIGSPWVGASFLHGAQPFALLLAGCFVAAAVAALAESLQTGIDDNLLVPLVGGATLFAATLVEPARLAEHAATAGGVWLAGAAVNAVLAVLAYAARGVTVGGAVWGWALGTALYGLGGWRGFLMLFGFFVLGTATTKLGYAKKAALGIAQEKGGRRGPRNAFANTLAGVLFAFLAVATPHTELFLLAVAAAFATAACDTCSSEIGQAYGRRHFLITTFRRVPAGTDGAVSVEGTLGGLAGAAVLAALAWAIGLVSPGGAVVVTVAAFFGATVESYLGATIEAIDAIDNELVNFANTAIGGAAALALGLLVL